MTSLVIRKEILTNCIAFVIHKNIYLEVNFIYFWYLKAAIRKFHFLACFSGFSRGATFSTQIWSYLKHRCIYQIGVNADSLRIIFWFRLKLTSEIPNRVIANHELLKIHCPPILRNHTTSAAVLPHSWWKYTSWIEMLFMEFRTLDMH